nr:virulence protein [uncultured Brumimicrobium sp.]
MFAISFDMLISDLKTHYGEVYNNAYYEIATVLEKFGFYRGQGSVYLSTNNNMANLLRAVNALKNIDWFKSSVRDIRAFRIEDWSDFTSFIKED